MMSEDSYIGEWVDLGNILTDLTFKESGMSMNTFSNPITIQGNEDVPDLYIGTQTKPIFIAEIGINHNGDMELAKELIFNALESKADIVKFQTHIPSEEMIPTHPLYGIIESCTLTMEDEQEIFAYCNYLNIMFMSTPFSITAVHRLANLGVSAFKTGSGELTHIPLQQEVAHQKLPTFISTGMSHNWEIKNTLHTVSQINPQIVLMNCSSIYPSTPTQINSKRIDMMKEWGCLVGQSDHTPTISTALGAIARGAVAIEKHFTLDRNMKGPDHSGSILPSEFRQMVDLGVEIWEATKEEARETYLNEEETVRDWAHHFLVTTKNIEEGERLSESNTTYKRVGIGVGGAHLIPASELEWFACRQTFFSKSLEINTPITYPSIL